MSLPNVKRAETMTVEIGGHAIDGYQVSNTGEFRAGVIGASLFVGYSRNWLSQVHNSRPQALKALHSFGFTGSQVELVVDGQGDRQNPLTLSLPDVAKVLRYAAMVGKKDKAIEVLCGLAEVSLYRYFDAAFHGRIGELAEMNRLFDNAKIRPALRGDFKRLTTDLGERPDADDHDYRRLA